MYLQMAAVKIIVLAIVYPCIWFEMICMNDWLGNSLIFISIFFSFFLGQIPSKFWNIFSLIFDQGMLYV